MKLKRAIAYGPFLFYIACLLWYFVLFIVGRTIFLVLNYKELGVYKTTLVRSYYEALYLDFSLFSYIAIPALLLMALSFFARNRIFVAVNLGFHVLISTVVLVLFVADAYLYTEWHTKINYQAVSHLRHPAEVIQITPIGVWLLTLIGLAVIVRFTLKYFQCIFTNLVKPKWLHVVSFLLLLALSAIGLRGGLQPIPIQESAVCFSSHIAVNDMTINTPWYFGHVMADQILHENQNPYLFYKVNEAEDIVKRYNLPKQAAPLSVLSVKQPNIVFIVLESFNANLSAYTGMGTFTPNLDRLAKEGIVFSNCFSSGHLSDQGIAAIYSGQTALPGISLINQTRKARKLTSLQQVLQSLGYHSAFYYGGQLSYGNIKNYLYAQGFAKIQEQKDIHLAAEPRHLGYADEDMAQYVLQELNRAQTPFFCNWFTISSHSPYDIPKPHQNLTTHDNAYVNSVKYTDSVLGLFFEKAKAYAWYKHTLFVLVADHSHDDHLANPLQSPFRNRIPLVLFGEPIQPQFRGLNMKNYVSQLELAKTVGLMLGASYKGASTDYHLFDTSARPIVYNYFNGAGVILDSNHYLSTNGEKLGVGLAKFDSPDSLTFYRYLQAYLQWHYENYRNL